MKIIEKATKSLNVNDSSLTSFWEIYMVRNWNILYGILPLKCPKFFSRRFVLQSKVSWFKKSKAKCSKDLTVCTILSSDYIDIVLCIIEQNHIILKNTDREIEFLLFSLLTQPLSTVRIYTMLYQKMAEMYSINL